MPRFLALGWLQECDAVRYEHRDRFCDDMEKLQRELVRIARTLVMAISLEGEW